MRTQPASTNVLGAGPAAIALEPRLGAGGGDPSGRAADRRPSRVRRGFRTATTPSNWRVRTKIIAILAVPVVAILANAGTGAVSVLHSTRDINKVSRLADLNRGAAGVITELQKERTYSVGRVAESRANPSAPVTSQIVTAQRTLTDQALSTFQQQLAADRGAFSGQAGAAVTSVSDRLSRLPAIRGAVLGMTSPDSVRLAYTALISGLVDLVAQIPQGNNDSQLNATVGAMSALAQASELTSLEQAQVYGALLSGRFSTADYRTFLSADTEKDNALAQFSALATPAQSELYRTTVTGSEVTQGNAYAQQIVVATSGQALDPATIVPANWIQWTQKETTLDAKVSAGLSAQLGTRIDALRGTIQRRALVSGLIIILILAAALVAAMIVARSLVRPLLSLRASALDVAGRRLPDAVRRLRDSTDQQIDVDIETVGISSDEEIGEVARAFDEVHREAVRLASEQAVLRNNVNAMFVNLSRRSQGLVERQLRLIDDLENREQDPDQLSNLFKLDHLATRMRRNNESLLVLAGTDTARRWTHPVPIDEVVLAAISEVEQYTRVRQTVAAGISVAGHAVSDVVHLVAELLENATAFSPPATEVVVSSHSLGPGAGAMIEIDDRGIGMPAKDLERVNERLASPPVVDVTVSRTMGLFAVGRLAGRHGIQVQLRESGSGGITALVRLPAKVITGEATSLPGRGQTGARVAAGTRAALEAGPTPAINARMPVGRPRMTETGPLALPMTSTVGPPNGSPTGDDRVIPDDRAPTAAGGLEVAAMTDSGPNMIKPVETDTTRSIDLGLDPLTGDFPILRTFGAEAPIGDAASSSTAGNHVPGNQVPSSRVPSSQVPSSNGHGGSQRGPADDRAGVEEMLARGSEHPVAPPLTPAEPPEGTGPTRISGGDEDEPRDENEDTAATPIFDSVSAWFQRRPPKDRAARRLASAVRPDVSVDPAVSVARSARPDQPPAPDVDVGSVTVGLSDGAGVTPAWPTPHRPTPVASEPAPLPYVAAPAPWPARQPAPVPEPATATAQGAAPVPEQVDEPVASAAPWTSANDEGWRAAEAAAREPVAGRTTSAGLPIRVPMTHLVPGSADAVASPAPATTPSRSPESVGGRLASFYQGVRQARAADSGSGSDGPRDFNREPRENS